MQGTGLIGIGAGKVYGYYVRDGGGLRVRVSVDDADALGLIAGFRLGVTLPRQPAADCLIARLTRDAPYVWLDLEVLSPPASRAG